MLLTILVFGLILSILVFIHELGHFMVAKKLGIRVEEFGFGLPPRLWGVKRGETMYSINALPIGGFVKLSGEDEDEASSAKRQAPSEKELRRFFWARTKLERSTILLAGVTMNFILAVIIISYIFTQGVFVPIDRVHIEKISENSPASAAGLKEGDVVISFDNQPIKSSEELIRMTKERLGEPTPIVVERNGKEFTLSVTPRKDPPPGEGPTGISISNLEEKKYSWYQAPFYGTLEAFHMSYVMLSTLATALYRLVTFQPAQVDIAGPIGIAQATGQAVRFGLNSVLQLMGLLSLNLAIINVLPIPALDGGRLLFVILEGVIGKRVKPQAERVAHQIGMAFLLALIALVTINDVLRIIRG